MVVILPFLFCWKSTFLYSVGDCQKPGFGINLDGPKPHASLQNIYRVLVTKHARMEHFAQVYALCYDDPDTGVEVCLYCVHLIVIISNIVAERQPWQRWRK